MHKHLHTPTTSKHVYVLHAVLHATPITTASAQRAAHPTHPPTPPCPPTPTCAHESYHRLLAQYSSGVWRQLDTVRAERAVARAAAMEASQRRWGVRPASDSSTDDDDEGDAARAHAYAGSTTVTPRARHSMRASLPRRVPSMHAVSFRASMLCGMTSTGSSGSVPGVGGAPSWQHHASQGFVDWPGACVSWSQGTRWGMRAGGGLA